VTARSGRASSSVVSSTPHDPATRSSRETASATDASSACVTSAAVRMRSADGFVDPAVELGAEPWADSLDEVEEELTVAFRAWQA
jgi:hypothetical protein